MLNIHINLANAKRFIIDLLHKLGLEAHKIYNELLSHFGAIETVIEKLLEVIKNPIVDEAIKMILGDSAFAAIPKLEGVLVIAIQDLSIAMKIKQDIDLAPTNEEKIKIFLVDLQKMDKIGKDVFISKLISLVLAGLNDNQLKQNIYDAFTQVHYSELKTN